RSKSGDIDAQLRELRLHILAHAESKAKNRAIRSLGLKSGFTEEDLKKPFVVAKLMWTGQTDDPELKRVFAEGTMNRMLGGSRALFGVAPEPRLPPPGRQLKAPPPVGSVGVDPDDFGMSGSPSDSGAYEAHPGVIDEPKSEPRRQTRGSQGGGEAAIPAGRKKGTPLSEAEEKDI